MAEPLIPGGGGPGSVIDTLLEIHRARKGPPSGVPEQPGYRGPNDEIYNQRQAGTSTEDVVASGILTDTVRDLQGPGPPVTDVPPITFPPVGPPYQDTDDVPDTDPTEPVLLPVPPEGDTTYIPPVTPPGHIPSPDDPNASSPYSMQGTGGPWQSGDVIVGGSEGWGGPRDQGIYGPYRYPGGPYRRGRPGQTRKYGDKNMGLPPGSVFQPETPWGQGYVRGRKTQTRRRRMPGAPVPLPFPRPFPTEPEPVPNPDDDETGRERPPLFPPDEEPANDTSIRRPPVQQVEPVRVPDPAGIRAPFPQPPTLPRVPAPPPVSMPPKEAPKWPVQPTSPSSVTVPQSVLSPSTPAPVTVPSGITSTSTPPTTARFPWQRAIAITAPLLLDLRWLSRSGARSPTQNVVSSAQPSPISPPSSTPGPTVTPIPTTPLQPVPLPAPLPVPAPLPQPITTPSAFEAPQGSSCETPRQTRERRERQRNECRRFITIKVPAHRKRVCAADAGRIIGKRLGKALGRAIGEATGLRRKKAQRKTARTAKYRSERAVRVTRHGVDVYGVGIELPHEMRPRIPGLPPIHGRR